MSLFNDCKTNGPQKLCAGCPMKDNLDLGFQPSIFRENNYCFFIIDKRMDRRADGRTFELLNRLVPKEN